MHVLIETTVRPMVNKVAWWRRLHRPDVDVPYQLYGDTVRYAWPLMRGSLVKNSIVYSFGIGQNASFEIDIIKQFDCNVYAFDPTPKSVEWAERQEFGEKFHFYPLGISDFDGEASFFPPSNPNHVSYSVRPGRNQQEKPIVAEVYTLFTIASRLAHARIDVLKMDIQGFESNVIEHLAGTSMRPAQALVEFHHGFYGISPKQTMSLVDRMKMMGYRIFWISDRGLEYGFVHASSLK